MSCRSADAALRCLVCCAVNRLQGTTRMVSCWKSEGKRERKLVLSGGVSSPHIEKELWFWLQDLADLIGAALSCRVWHAFILGNRPQPTPTLFAGADTEIQQRENLQGRTSEELTSRHRIVAWTATHASSKFACWLQFSPMSDCNASYGRGLSPFQWRCVATSSVEMASCGADVNDPLESQVNQANWKKFKEMERVAKVKNGQQQTHCTVYYPIFIGFPPERWKMATVHTAAVAAVDLDSPDAIGRHYSNVALFPSFPLIAQERELLVLGKKQLARIKLVT